jgi:hypothetical protein
VNGDEHAGTKLQGLDMFRVECLRPAGLGEAPFEGQKPFYEVWREGKVKAGHYSQVIRYRDHLRPLEEALRENMEMKLG